MQQAGQRDRRLLGRIGVERLHPEPLAGETHAEVGVLRHVPGVPPADLDQARAAEMVRRSAQEEGETRRGQAGVEHREQRCVVESVEGLQAPVVRVVDGESRLHAADVGGGARELRRRAPQLERIGAILGIEDREKLAAGERQRDVHRARLRPRLPVGSDDDVMRQVRRMRRERVPGLGIVAFDDELHLELRAWVIAPLGSKLT